MKLKNLFLTSLVALALGACSNASEEATTANGEASAKTSTLSLNLGFNNAISRADDVSAGSDQVGTALENNATTIDVKIVYSDANVSPDIYHFNVATDFTPNTDKTQYELNADKKMAVSKDEVTGATVYVTVNGQGTKESNTNFTDGVVNATYNSSFADLTAAGQIANPNNFLMSGLTQSVKIIQGSATNSVTVNVDRVAAKLQELTPTTNFFTTTDYNVNTDATNYTTEKLGIKFLNYTYLNLNKTSYIYKQTNPYASATSNYFQYKEFTAKNNVAFASPMDIKTIGAPSTVADNAEVNYIYSMENGSTTPTKVLYKAQICDKDGNPITTNCYSITVNGKTSFYSSFAKLDAANNNRYTKAFNLKDDATGTSTYDEFRLAGVKQYVAGICYYIATVQTATVNNYKILRNNWYQLSVQSVNALGNAVPDPDIDVTTTLLTLKVVVNPWKVNINHFNL